MPVSDVALLYRRGFVGRRARYAMNPAGRIEKKNSHKRTRWEKKKREIAIRMELMNNQNE
jgi:hypothetical protein